MAPLLGRSRLAGQHSCLRMMRRCAVEPIRLHGYVGGTTRELALVVVLDMIHV